MCQKQDLNDKLHHIFFFISLGKHSFFDIDIQRDTINGPDVMLKLDIFSALVMNGSPCKNV